ncbi:LysR family transcriptional regulator [Lachnospiraceae bacterium 45-P1]
MTLKQMRYAMAVASFGSINDAARRLYITQPALTNSLRQLEAELGFSIFLRSRSGIEITPNGQEFLRQIRTVVERVDAISDRFRTSGKECKTLSVSAQHYNFASDAFVRLLQDSGPRYTFTFLETTTLQVMENTALGYSELGILYYSKSNESVLFRELKNRALTFHPLFKTAPHVFLRSGHPLCEKDRLTLNDLEPYPFVLYSQGQESSYNFLEEIIPAADRAQVIYIQDRSTCYRILEHTDAYSIGTGILAQNSSRSCVLSIPLSGCDEMYIGWIQKNGSVLSPLALQFLDLIQV